jgi:toxin ParE1/3/4
MESKPFRFHPEAREEFRDAMRWYRARSIIASAEFRIAVSGAIRSVAQSPKPWPKYLQGTRQFVLHRFPFSIVYLDDPDLVTIVAVARANLCLSVFRIANWRGNVTWFWTIDCPQNQRLSSKTFVYPLDMVFHRTAFGGWGNKEVMGVGQECPTCRFHQGFGIADLRRRRPGLMVWRPLRGGVLSGR